MVSRLGIGAGIGIPFRNIASGGGKPYLPPELKASLRVVAIDYGKTNSDPDRAIIKNLVDPDNPLIISNAAFKLNSGHGLYGMDFLDWKSNSGMNFTSTKLTSTKPNLSGGWLTFRNVSGLIPETKVKVSGAPREFGFIGNNNSTDDKFSVTINNGVYTIPEFTLSSASGFYINNNSGDWSKLVIEQIPSFEGAFVTDGINDLITSTKTVQEMGITNEVTVVSMIHQIELNQNYKVGNTNYIRNIGFLRNQVKESGKTGIYGYAVTNPLSTGKNIQVINTILGDKNDYTSFAGNDIVSNSSLFSVQGFKNEAGVISETSQVAWYWTVIANKVLTTDQINQVIAYYNLDRCVEPTVLYDVKKQGLSNDTPDSDWYLKDYSGNGYDMTLYNYAKTPESGINEDGGLQSDGVYDYGKVTGLPIYKDYTVVADYVRTFAEENVQDAPILSKSQVVGDGAFLFNYLNVNSVISSYSFGTNNVLANVSDSERKIYYQSKYVNGGKSINSGTGTDYDSMWLGTYRDDSQIFFTGAIYSLMTFPYSMSEFLIERQLKKRKAGTLYPDMVEFRPIIKANANYNLYGTFTVPVNGTWTPIKVGDYIPKGSRIALQFYFDSDVSELASAVSSQLTNIHIEKNGHNTGWTILGYVNDKSPQKIDITIDEYIRYEDMNFTSAYPFVPLFQDVSWGDKLKVGDEVKFIGFKNILPDLYIRTGEMKLNGNNLITNSSVVIGKSMIFEISKNYTLDNNAPKCILSPSRLRIPNSSYKILGYIPDLSGNGNHGKINNSAYAGMSGANGYPNNFNGYTVVSGVTKTDSGIKVEKELTGSGWLLLIPANTAVASMKLNIVGIPSNKTIKWSTNVEGIGDITLVNGINEIPTYTSASTSGIYTIFSDLKDLKIEQIGEYEGAYCLDGVDDFISIPTTVGGKQVLMKVNWQSSIAQAMLYDQRGYANEFAIWNSNSLNDNVDGVIPAYQSRNNGQTYIDGILNNNIKASELRAITHNITITNELSSGVNNTYPVIGANKTVNGYFANMSLYDFMLFDEISTDEEILTLNKHIGIEPKVTVPPYYWDAYGRSNMEAAYDRALMLNLGKIPSNDTSNALTAKNMAWDEMSGYGGYSFKSFDTTSRWNVYPSSGETAAIEIISRNGYSITLKKKLEDIYSWQFNYGSTVTNLSEDLKFNVKCDKPIKVIWQFKYRLVAGESYRTETISTNDLTANVEANLTLLHKTPAQLEEMGVIQHYYLIYFNNAKLAIDEEYTITMLPIYPNGLVLDGVTDYLFNAIIPALTDYTYIIKRTLLSTADNSCTIFKGRQKSGGGGAFISEYRTTNNTYNNYSFGNSTNVNVSNDNIVYGTKASYNGLSVPVGTSTDDSGLTLGKWNNYTKMIFYKLLLYPKTLPVLEINYLKNMLAREEIIDLTNPIFK